MIFSLKPPHDPLVNCMMSGVRLPNLRAHESPCDSRFAALRKCLVPGGGLQYPPWGPAVAGVGRWKTTRYANLPRLKGLERIEAPGRSGTGDGTIWNGSRSSRRESSGPKKVRIYRRASHFVLQWWDKAEKRNLCERIDGDLLAALMRARQIDERLEHFRSASNGVAKTQHSTLVEKFTGDLHRRADAGEIDPRTVRRYESALKHYQGFVSQPEVARQFPHVSLVNREFALKLAAHLRSLQVSPNGHANSPGRPMSRPDYVVDVTRAMFDWAADPQRGKLIPDGFHNPFLHRGRSSSTAVSVPVGEPDITIKMAVDFLAACDLWQLRLFSPVIIYGLRAAEPCFLFHEHVNGGWLDVPCLPEVDYFTKGRRAKRLPLIPAIAALLRTTSGPCHRACSICAVTLRRVGSVAG